MAHRKWRETKLHPGTAGPGSMLGCCLIYFHFLWAILCPQTVEQYITGIAQQDLVGTKLQNFPANSDYLIVFTREKILPILHILKPNDLGNLYKCISFQVFMCPNTWNRHSN